MKMIRIIMFIALCLFFISPCFSQEAIGSYLDQYYDFMALKGELQRPYLNYKTLSDATWDGSDTLRIYGPELFSSYNGDQPYGQNDGALWQGRGFNTSLTGGARIALQGFELTLKPQISFSQNQSFDLVASEYPSEYGYIWGYSLGKGADAPQRFGDDPLFKFSWGDSELRYTWRTLSVGFGTQSPWLGPGRVNAIMHSNNAPPYPKADIGIRRTPISIMGSYLGDLEARLWAGYLSESDYFDEDEENDHTLISALTVAYAPSFLPGLTLFANRSYLAPWEPENASAITSLFFVNLWGVGDEDCWDQRASLGFTYLLPAAGLEFYGEAGMNDYAKNLSGYIRYPFTTMVYSGGFRKTVDLPFLDDLSGELCFEWSNLEISQNYQFVGPASFYMHHQIKQGYTNLGQWLGAGNGTGGNSQYLGFKVYQGKNLGEIYIHRSNPDNDYIYRISATNGKTFDASRDQDFKVTLCIGLRGRWQTTQAVALSAGAAYLYIQNPTYFAPHKPMIDKLDSFRLEAAVSYSF